MSGLVTGAPLARGPCRGVSCYLRNDTVYSAAYRNDYSAWRRIRRAEFGHSRPVIPVPSFFIKLDVRYPTARVG